MSPSGRILTLMAGLLVIVSAFLPWVGGDASNDTALDVSSGWAFGLDGERSSATWLGSLLFVIVVGAVLVMVGSTIGSALIAGLAGLAVVAVVLLWGVQEIKLLNGGSLDVRTVSNATLGGDLAAGLIIAIIGGLLAIVCALFLPRARTDVAAMAV